MFKFDGAAVYRVIDVGLLVLFAAALGYGVKGFRQARAAVIVLALIATSGLAPANAQVTLTLRNCARCGLQIQPVATLSGSDIFGELNNLAIDRDGRMFTTQFQRADEILVFDANGRLERVIGREGRGPGEFVRIGALGILDDTLYVADPGGGRLSIFTTAGDFVRSVSLPLPNAEYVLIRNHGSLLISGMSISRRASGFPLHEIDPATGQIIKSYGARDPVVNPSRPYLNSRVAVYGADGAVWSAHRTAYELERWNADHERTLTLRRSVDWFEPWVDRPMGQPDPPPPWLMAIANLDARHLLVAITRPVNDYTKLLGPKIPMAGGYYYDRNRRRLLYDTVLEVVDTENATVVTRRLMDDYVIGLAPRSNVGYTYNENNGEPEIGIFRILFTLNER